MNDPTSLYNRKYMREEGFQNVKMRSLTVSAFLRCLHGAIEYAPTVELR